jgi:hypothetical protein
MSRLGARALVKLFAAIGLTGGLTGRASAQQVVIRTPVTTDGCDYAQINGSWVRVGCQLLIRDRLY